MTAQEFGLVGFRDRLFVQRLRAGRVLTDDEEVKVRLVIVDWPLWASAYRGPKIRPGMMAETIRALTDEGMPARTIAARTGASLKYVQQVRNRYLWG